LITLYNKTIYLTHFSPHINRTIKINEYGTGRDAEHVAGKRNA